MLNVADASVLLFLSIILLPFAILPISINVLWKLLLLSLSRLGIYMLKGINKILA